MSAGADRAREIQARLEEKRAQLPAKPAVPEAPEAKEYLCVRCGKPFSLEPVGNIKIALPDGSDSLTVMCPGCYAETRNIAVLPPEPPRPSPVNMLVGMEELGINVRKHGHLTLEELGSPAAQIGATFIAAVLRADRFGEVDGLYIWGVTGTGKSQLAVSIVRGLLATGAYRARDIVYDRARSMVTQLQDRYKTGEVDAFSQRRARAGLWVYEDAGTEKQTPDAFRVMEDIFDRREGHPTIVTSNLNRPELIKHWSATGGGTERFRSRLGPYEALELLGTDRRFG